MVWGLCWVVRTVGGEMEGVSEFFFFVLCESYVFWEIIGF